MEEHRIEDECEQAPETEQLRPVQPPDGRSVSGDDDARDDNGDDAGGVDDVGGEVAAVSDDECCEYLQWRVGGKSEKEEAEEADRQADRRAAGGDLQESNRGVANRWRAAEDRRQHRGEHRDSCAVVEEALALENGRQARGSLHLAHEGDDRDGIGGRKNRAEQHAAGPAQSEDEVGQGPDQDDGERDAHGREETDRKEAAPELRQVECERGLEDQPGHEGQEDHVRADMPELPARQQTDDHAGRGQHDGVGDQASAL